MNDERTLERALGAVSTNEDPVPEHPVPTKPDAAPKKIRPDKATWKKGRDGQFYWYILSANGKDVKAIGGEGYKRKNGALNALRSDQARWAQPGGLVIYDDPEAVKPKKKAKKVVKKAAKKAKK